MPSPHVTADGASGNSSAAASDSAAGTHVPGESHEEVQDEGGQGEEDQGEYDEYDEYDEYGEYGEYDPPPDAKRQRTTEEGFA